MGHTSTIHSCQFSQVTHIAQRVSIHHEKVSVPSRGNTAEIVLPSHVARRNRSDGFECRHRADRFGEKFDLTQQGKSRRWIGKSTTVRPTYNQAASLVQDAGHLLVLLKRFDTVAGLEEPRMNIPVWSFPHV